MSLDPRIAQACFTRDCWRCRHCRSRTALEPHHVVFRSHGGTDDLWNLLTLCHCCHIEGIHGGRLLLEVIELLPNDLRVRFVRKKGWKPT